MEVTARIVKPPYLDRLSRELIVWMDFCTCCSQVKIRLDSCVSFLVTCITISTQSQRSCCSMLWVLASFCVMQWSYFGCNRQPRVSKLTLHYYGQSQSGSSDVQQNMLTFDRTCDWSVISHCISLWLPKRSLGGNLWPASWVCFYPLKLKTVISGGKLCFTKGLKQPKWICLLVYYDNHSLWNKWRVTRGICAWSMCLCSSFLLSTFLNVTLSVGAWGFAWTRLSKKWFM